MRSIGPLAFVVVLALASCEGCNDDSCKLWWCDGGIVSDGEVFCGPPPPIEEWPDECVTTYEDAGR